MTLSITLDWLALTFKETTREFLSFRDIYANSETVADEAPRNGYNSARRDQNGVVCMWHTVREEMGYHIIFTGSALRNIFRSPGTSQRSLVEAAVNSGGRITRLDIAKDAENVAINLTEIWRYIRAKETRGDARTFSTIESENGSRTIYVGSRTSERFARIYDKAGEQGLTNANWTRFELETKGMVARALANLLVNEKDWASAFDGMALAMLQIPESNDYQQLFSTDVVPVGIPKLEKSSDREAWIQTQVIAAVGSHYQENPDSKAVNLLMETLYFIKRSRKGFKE